MFYIKNVRDVNISDFAKNPHSANLNSEVNEWFKWTRNCTC